MLLKDKIKLAVPCILFTILFIWVITDLDVYYQQLDDTEIEVIVHDIQNEIDKSFVNLYEDMITTEKLTIDILETLPDDRLNELILLVSVEKIYDFVRIFNNLDIEQRSFLYSIFPYLNNRDIVLLIRISEKLSEKELNVLISVLLKIPRNSQHTIIKILVKLSINDIMKLVYLADNFHRELIVKMVTVLSNSSDPSKILHLVLQIPSKYYIDLFNSLIEIPSSYVDIFYDTVKLLNDNLLINAIELFIKLPPYYRSILLTQLYREPLSTQSTVIDMFSGLSDNHVKNAILLIKEDPRLLEKGVLLSSRLKRILGRNETINTLERSINTASRTDVDTRYRGANILLNDVRSHGVKRVLNQVDGQPEVFSDYMIEQIVLDYEKVHNPSYFVDMLSGSSGIIMDRRYITQDRKLEVIKETYEGNLMDDKDRLYKRFDTDKPFTPLRLHDEFEIKDPKILELEGL